MNCKECGTFISSSGVKAIKECKFCFQVDVSPQEMLSSLIKDEKKYAIVFNPNLQSYFNERNKILSQVRNLALRFNQRVETLHLCVELLDRFFLKQKEVQLNPRNFILYTITCFLIASKYDELDQNIPFVKDLLKYYSMINNNYYRDQIPHYESIIECERKLMHFFEWELMFVLPIHIINALLANGIVFDNEEDQTQIEFTQQVRKSIQEMNDNLLKEMHRVRDKYPSEIAASIVYLSRKQNIEQNKRKSQIWSIQLEQLTSYKEEQLIETSCKIEQLLYPSYSPSVQQNTSPPPSCHINKQSQKEEKSQEKNNNCNNIQKYKKTLQQQLNLMLAPTTQHLKKKSIKQNLEKENVNLSMTASNSIKQPLPSAQLQSKLVYSKKVSPSQEYLKQKNEVELKPPPVTDQMDKQFTILDQCQTDEYQYTIPQQLESTFNLEQTIKQSITIAANKNLNNINHKKQASFNAANTSIHNEDSQINKQQDAVCEIKNEQIKEEEIKNPEQALIIPNTGSFMYDASIEESSKYVPIRSKQVHTMKRLIPTIKIEKGKIAQGGCCSKTFRSLDTKQEMKAYISQIDTQINSITNFIGKSSTSLPRKEDQAQAPYLNSNCNLSQKYLRDQIQSVQGVFRNCNNNTNINNGQKLCEIQSSIPLRRGEVCGNKFKIDSTNYTVCTEITNEQKNKHIQFKDKIRGSAEGENGNSTQMFNRRITLPPPQINTNDKLPHDSAEYCGSSSSSTNSVIDKTKIHSTIQPSKMRPGLYCSSTFNKSNERFMNQKEEYAQFTNNFLHNNPIPSSNQEAYRDFPLGVEGRTSMKGKQNPKEEAKFKLFENKCNKNNANSNQRQETSLRARSQLKTDINQVNSVIIKSQSNNNSMYETSSRTKQQANQSQIFRDFYTSRLTTQHYLLFNNSSILEPQRKLSARDKYPCTSSQFMSIQEGGGGTGTTSEKLRYAEFAKLFSRHYQSQLSHREDMLSIIEEKNENNLLNYSQTLKTNKFPAKFTSKKPFQPNPDCPINLKKEQKTTFNDHIYNSNTVLCEIDKGQEDILNQNLNIREQFPYKKISNDFYTNRETSQQMNSYGANYYQTLTTNNNRSKQQQYLQMHNKSGSQYVHIKINRVSSAKKKGEDSQNFSSTTNSSQEERGGKIRKSNNQYGQIVEEDKLCCVFEEDERMDPKKPTQKNMIKGLYDKNSHYLKEKSAAIYSNLYNCNSSSNINVNQSNLNCHGKDRGKHTVREQSKRLLTVRLEQDVSSVSKLQESTAAYSTTSGSCTNKFKQFFNKNSLV